MSDSGKNCASRPARSPDRAGLGTHRKKMVTSRGSKSDPIKRRIPALLGLKHLRVAQDPRDCSPSSVSMRSRSATRSFAARTWTSPTALWTSSAVACPLAVSAALRSVAASAWARKRRAAATRPAASAASPSSSTRWVERRHKCGLGCGHPGQAGPHPFARFRGIRGRDRTSGGSGGQLLVTQVRRVDPRRSKTRAPPGAVVVLEQVRRGGFQPG